MGHLIRNQSIRVKLTRFFAKIRSIPRAHTVGECRKTPKVDFGYVTRLMDPRATQG